VNQAAWVRLSVLPRVQLALFGADAKSITLSQSPSASSCNRGSRHVTGVAACPWRIHSSGGDGGLIQPSTVLLPSVGADADRRFRSVKTWLWQKSLRAGVRASRFSHSEAFEASQTSSSSSIAVPMSRVCAAKNTQGLLFPALLNARKCSIVPTSCETRTRCCPAASARTSRSFILRNPAA